MLLVLVDQEMLHNNNKNMNIATSIILVVFYINILYHKKLYLKWFNKIEKKVLLISYELVKYKLIDNNTKKLLILWYILCKIFKIKQFIKT